MAQLVNLKRKCAVQAAKITHLQKRVQKLELEVRRWRDLVGGSKSTKKEVRAGLLSPSTAQESEGAWSYLLQQKYTQKLSTTDHSAFIQKRMFSIRFVHDWLVRISSSKAHTPYIYYLT